MTLDFIHTQRFNVANSIARWKGRIENMATKKKAKKAAKKKKK